MQTPKILFTLAAALCLYGVAGFAPVMAQNNSCAAWKFALEQEEVGKVWSASVCSAGDKGESYLSLSCIGASINLRYMPVVEGEFENQKHTFVFSDGASQVSLLLAYEAMDGAFAGDVAHNGKLIALLRKGAELTVSDLGAKVPDAKVPDAKASAAKVPAKRFSLRGAGKALAGLVSKCK